MIKKFEKSPWVPYVFPFAIFILLTGVAQYFPDFSHYFYISKTVITGWLLWFWRRKYIADITQRITLSEFFLSLLAGLLVLVIWIVPEGHLIQIGGADHTGFNPYSFGWPPIAVACLITVRLTGAAVVVPIMEELFWRSFLLRYVINPDFRLVALGTFSWASFLSVVILFGFEHYRVIQGIIAGIIYTLLIIRQKNISGCIVAHSTTNFGLGIYVLSTKSWIFW